MVHSVLVVIDMQRDVMASCPAAEPVIAAVNGLLAAARRCGVPIVFVCHHDEDMAVGSDAWQLDTRLDHRDGDLVVDKAFRDGCAANELGDLLRRLGARRVVIAGAHSDFCVQTTALSALAPATTSCSSPTATLPQS